jgi:hypothetical protein
MLTLKRPPTILDLLRLLIETLEAEIVNKPRLASALRYKLFTLYEIMSFADNEYYIARNLSARISWGIDDEVLDCLIALGNCGAKEWARRAIGVRLLAIWVDEELAAALADPNPDSYRIDPAAIC